MSLLLGEGKEEHAKSPSKYVKDLEHNVPY